MKQNQKYRILAENHLLQNSVMGIVPDNARFKFQSENIEKALARSSHFTLLNYEASSLFENSPEKIYKVQIAYLKEVYIVHLSVQPVSVLNLQDFGLSDMISKKDYNTALEQEYYLELSLCFSAKILDSFHLQLKLLDAIVPKASIIIDFSSFRLYSGKGIRLTAKSQTPPSPDYLYALHASYQNHKDTVEYWLHTHGLLRCGLVELEIIDIRTDPQQMANLISGVVKRFLYHPVEENIPFTIGYDGMHIHLVWINRNDALLHFSDSVLGGNPDRIPGDSNHSSPSGILFAIEDNNLMSPEIYTSTLANNPILYISDEETARMSKLAKERYEYFLLLFRKNSYGTGINFLNIFFQKKDLSNHLEWDFYVKIGLLIDNPKRENEKEHLWYKVILADDKTITGKLLNKPYWIASLAEGDIKTYPIKLLTDWCIYDPDKKSYTPDSIYELLDI